MQFSTKTLPIACAVLALFASEVPTVYASDVTADIPQVPVRVLRPDAQDASPASTERVKVDTFSRAARVTPPSDDTSVTSTESASDSPAYRINEAHTIHMEPGENVFIPIAVNHPNRILTPFKNPQVISTTLSGSGKKGECGELCVRDSVVYVTTDKTYPVTAFITEEGREDIALSVTMMPRRVPPREVKLTVSDDVMESLRRNSDGLTGDNAAARAWETSRPYVDTLREAFRTIALQEIPQGYTLRDVKSSDALPSCKHPGLAFDFAHGQILEGHGLNFYVGVMTNVADTPVEFREQRCGGWRIAAVTSWPLKVLRPGQQTEVYFAVKREESTPAPKVRRALIRRDYN